MATETTLGALSLGFPSEIIQYTRPIAAEFGYLAGNIERDFRSGAQRKIIKFDLSWEAVSSGVVANIMTQWEAMQDYNPILLALPDGGKHLVTLDPDTPTVNVVHYAGVDSDEVIYDVNWKLRVSEFGRTS